MAAPFLSDSRNKLMYVEMLTHAYMNEINVPEEYQPLLLSFAGKYLEQDGQWDILSQHRQVGPFSFWVQDVFTHEGIILCPYTPYPLWSLHFMFDVSLRVKLYEDAAFSLNQGECNLFNLCSDQHLVPMPGGMHMLSCHINILPAAFRKLAVNFPIMRGLANKKTGIITGAMHEQPYYINRTNELLIRNILTCNYTEEAQIHYFIQRCILDIFISFSHQDAQSDQPVVFHSALHADVFQQIFSYLLKHPHLNHSIAALAEMFYMDEKTLRFGFRQHFFMPVVAFIRMQKMILVFDLLVNSGESLKNIAHVAGFRSAEEMRKRFEWYYGCRVSLLRNDW